MAGKEPEPKGAEQQDTIQQAPQQPILPPDVLQMASEAAQQGISLKEYLRREAQSAAQAEAHKSVGKLSEWQKKIDDAGKAFDDLAVQWGKEGSLAEGADLQVMRRNYIARVAGDLPQLGREEPQTPEPAPGQQDPGQQAAQDPMLAYAVTIAHEEGLQQGDPELQMVSGQSWDQYYASIRAAGDAKRKRTGADPRTVTDSQASSLRGAIPGEIGARGSHGDTNEYENVYDPGALLDEVDWKNLNLPKG